MSVASFRATMTPGLSANERLIYQCLVFRANGRRFCWPKVSTMASEFGMTRATVMRATARLAELGLIRVERKRQRQANHYFILDPDGRLYADGPVIPASVECTASAPQLPGGITIRPLAEPAPVEVLDLDPMPDRWWERPAPAEVAKTAPPEVAPARPLEKDSRKEKRETPSPASPSVQKNKHLSLAHTLARARVAHAVGVDDVKVIFNRWREKAAGTPLPSPSVLSPDLRHDIVVGIRACGTAAILEAIDLVTVSAHCRAELPGSSGWRATLDWVVKPKFCRRALDGYYTSAPKASGFRRGSLAEAVHDWGLVPPEYPHVGLTIDAASSAVVLA